ncbi:MAG: Gfo/Idh/MocA family oxidoreductase [Verrucomicrobia bacterium]|nr:Gfo/Idh/MocA family oxidoreductase [Verrucomicrobiota bacterium]
MNPIQSSDSHTFINRRHFLKSSAAVAGTAMLGSLDLSRSVHAAESNVIRLGLIGCGGRGSGAASDALTGDPNTKLCAVADVFPDKIESALKGLSKKYGDRVQVDASRQFSGLDGYRGVIENCDVVMIACASRFHAPYGLAAVKAKKHVFVEKPAAVDVAGIYTILEADELSKKNGTGFLAGVTYRYHLGRREAIKRIHGGEIGDILAIQCDYLRTPYRLIERDPAWSEMEYQFRNWYHFTWLSGDDVPQSLIHNLDSAFWALHDELPEAAYGMGGRSTHFQASMGTSFDHHHVTYEYADGRSIYGSCRTAAGCFGSNKDIFHGTKGRCKFSAFQPPVITDLKGNVVWKADALPPGNTPYIQEHKEFLESIRAGKPFQRGKILADSTMGTVLGQMAIYNGQRIAWKDAMNSKFAFPPQGEISMKTEPPVKPGADGIYPVAIPGTTKLY